MQPVDLTTGLVCGTPTQHMVEVVIGYLATHRDGTTARLGLDKGRADQYAITHRATIEPIYVKRAPGAFPSAHVNA